MIANRHMNLFEHYRQEGEIPHENNLSRSLAILLDENALLFDRFIDLVNSKLLALGKTPICKPKNRDDREIGFQQRTGDLCDGVSRRIIGFTLSPELPQGTKDKTRETQPVHENLVTDIAIFCGEDLLIIEVKKVPGSSAGAQVTAQAESLCPDCEDVEVVSPLCLTWEEVIHTLQTVLHLQGEGQDPMLRHYLEYLDMSCQAWFPVIPFGRAEKTGLAAFKRRLRSLAENCFQLLDTGQDPIETKVYRDGNGFIVPLKITGNYTRELHLCPWEEGARNEGIQAVLWLGNNIGQARSLFEAHEIRDDMSWTLEKSITVDERVLEAEITPYLKFSHIMGRFVMEAYGSPDFIGTNRPDIRKKFFVPLARRWRREEWPELLEHLTTKNLGLLKNADIFGRDFQEKFRESERNFVTVAPGYEVVIKIPASVLEELDRQPLDLEKGNDRVAHLIVNIVKTLRGKIEVFTETQALQ